MQLQIDGETEEKNNLVNVSMSVLKPVENCGHLAGFEAASRLSWLLWCASVTACNLGVVLDSHLTIAAQVSTVCYSQFFQVYQLCPVLRLLSSDATKTLVQAFISTPLDYCNSLLYGINDNLFHRLYAIQNATAHLVTSVRRSEHIKPVLRQLYWLLVKQWVDFKLFILVFKALCSTAPPYMAEDCQLVVTTDRHQLLSSTVNTCYCSIIQMSSCLGNCSCLTWEWLWNSLPVCLR